MSVRWYRPMHRIGIILGAIAIVVFGTEAAIAIRNNQIIVGWNAWHQPLFAVTQFIVALVAGPVLLRYALRHWDDPKPPVRKDD